MRAKLALGLAAVLLGAAACSPEPPAESGNPDATLTIATTTDVVNFNPLIGNSRTDSWITDLMYPRMLTINATGDKEPYLAKEHGYKDPTTGFYELRDDMKWSDGKPVSAEDVAYTINVIMRDKPAGNTTFGQLSNVESAAAVSPTRVEVKLKRPDANVIAEVGFWMTVVPKHVFEPAGNIAKFANNSGTWVSAGPYKLTQVAKGQSYTLERQEPYPFAKDGKPSLSKIVFRVYPDINTEILALKNGDVDLIANALPPAQVKQLQGQAGIKVTEAPGLGYAHMTYNMTKPLMNNLKVRQALAHAVDYEAIRSVVLQGQAVSTGSSPIPPVLKNWVKPDLKEYAYDTELSKRLLAEAGVTNPQFNMIYSLQDAVTSQWASIVKDGAAKAGITINLQGQERNTYLANTASGNYDIYAGNFAIMDDPVTNMALTFLPGGAINYTKVDDPALSALITEAQSTTDREKQKQLVWQAATIVRDNVYDNVMYMQNLYFAHTDKATGFVVKPSELLSLVDPESLANVQRS